MEKPTQRYRDVARLFREHARSEGPAAVPAPATAEELSAAQRALVHLHWIRHWLRNT
jgi:hypothetical protein